MLVKDIHITSQASPTQVVLHQEIPERILMYHHLKISLVEVPSLMKGTDLIMTRRPCLPNKAEVGMQFRLEGHQLDMRERHLLRHERDFLSHEMDILSHEMDSEANVHDDDFDCSPISAMNSPPRLSLAIFSFSFYDPAVCLYQVPGVSDIFHLHLFQELRLSDGGLVQTIFLRLSEVPNRN